MQRKHHWDLALAGIVHARAQTPFCYGANDCCLFVADAIQAMTDTDIAAEFRGEYSTERKAFAAIRRITGAATVGAVLAYVAAQYGMPQLAAALCAQRGDMVLVEDDGRMIAGIIGLGGQPLAVGEEGLHELPASSIRQAWAVAEDRHQEPHHG